jgi:hypothetical protein
MPYPVYFPFDTLEADIARPTRYNPAEQSSSSSWFGGFSKSKNVQHLKVDKFAPKGTLPADKIDLASALQYGTAVRSYRVCLIIN